MTNSDTNKHFITNNLAETVLFAPLSQGVADRIAILSGYATPNMASWYLKQLEEKCIKASVELIVGMTPKEGLSQNIHRAFVELHSPSNKDIQSHFSCSYLQDNTLAEHGNLYIFLRNEEPIIAYTGSASFVQNSFIGAKQREIMFPCDPSWAWQYYRKIINKAIYCNHNELENYVMITSERTFLDKENTSTILQQENVVRENLSLLTKNNTVGKHSGLNWGQRDGRNPNQAYIPVPRSIAKSGFFPTDGRHITASTDDNKILILRLEQAHNKALTTPLSNAKLGEYFRNRLNLANGAPVTKSDLEKYGRTDVSFIKYDDEEYFMDFSVPALG